MAPSAQSGLVVYDAKPLKPDAVFSPGHYRNASRLLLRRGGLGFLSPSACPALFRALRRMQALQGFGAVVRPNDIQDEEQYRQYVYDRRALGDPGPEDFVHDDVLKRELRDARRQIRLVGLDYLAALGLDGQLRPEYTAPVNPQNYPIPDPGLMYLNAYTLISEGAIAASGHADFGALSFLASTDMSPSWFDTHHGHGVQKVDSAEVIVVQFGHKYSLDYAIATERLRSNHGVVGPTFANRYSISIELAPRPDEVAHYAQGLASSVVDVM